MQGLEGQALTVFAFRRLNRQLEQLARQLVDLERKIEQLRAELEQLQLTGTLRRFK
jgi:phage shock protein A